MEDPVEDLADRERKSHEPELPDENEHDAVTGTADLCGDRGTGEPPVISCAGNATCLDNPRLPNETKGPSHEGTCEYAEEERG